MFATSPSQFPSQSGATGSRSLLNRRLAGLAGSLMRSWRRHQALHDWNRNLSRPPGCSRVPDRVWRRHSALLAVHSATYRREGP